MLDLHDWILIGIAVVAFFFMMATWRIVYLMWRGR